MDELVRPSERVSDTQQVGIRLLSAAYEVHEMSRDGVCLLPENNLRYLELEHSREACRDSNVWMCPPHLPLYTQYDQGSLFSYTHRQNE